MLNYRKVLAAFIDKSQGAIGTNTLIHAYFEDTGPAGGTESRRELVREVKRTYGVGALSKLDKLMDLSVTVGADHLEEVVLSRIHPPECDDQGRIIRPGYIDTENIPTFYELMRQYPPRGVEPWTPDDSVATVATGKEFVAHNVTSI